MNIKRLFGIIWISVAVGLIPVASSGGAILLDSTLSSGSLLYGSGGWYAMGTSGSVPTMSTDNTTPMSGGVLYYYYNNIALIGAFTPIALTKPGDYIQASYNVRYIAIPSNQSTGPALGLYSSSGTYVTENIVGSTGATSDDKGYKVYKNRLDSSDLTVVRNATGFGNNNGGGTALTLSNASTGLPINDASVVHTVTLKVALADNWEDLLITATFDGYSYNTVVTGSNVLTYSFDEIGLQPFGNWAGSRASVDNVLVTTNASVVNSDFSSGSISYGDGGWFAMGTYGSVPTISTDNISPLSGNVLYYSYNNIATIGGFAPVALAKAGDYVQATYNVRYPELPTNLSTGPALGLYHSGNTYLLSNSIGSVGATSDDKGYKMYKTIQASSDLTLVRNLTGFGSINSGGAPTVLSVNSTSAPIDNAAVAHTVTLKISLAENLQDLLITTNFDTYSSATTVSGSDVVTYTFDEVGIQPFGNWAAKKAYVDNIVITTNVVSCVAQKLGYEKVFSDDFDDIGTIDIDNTHAAGFNWYRQFFFGATPTPAGANITVANSVLTLGGIGQSGRSLCTAVPVATPSGWLGQAWKGGYFEARIRFDPFLHVNSTGWPAFWSMAVEHLAGKGADRWSGEAPLYDHFGEIDFFEYLSWKWLGHNTSYQATVHDWYGICGDGYLNSNNCGKDTPFNNATVRIPGGTDFSQWHIYGCLWVPEANGEPGYIQYYFDNYPLGGLVTWSGIPQSAPPVSPWVFSIFDQQNFAMVLTTGNNWPMDVDWVRVWQP